MKKNIFSLVIGILIPFIGMNTIFASAGDPSSPDFVGPPAPAGAGSSSASSDVITFTSEKVPGATCECVAEGGCDINVAKRKYKCTTGAGVTGFQAVFAQMIRYVVNIVLLLGVLAVAGVGIAWTFAGGDDIKLKTTIKQWGMNIVIGAIILFMFAYILKFLAPWVYR